MYVDDDPSEVFLDIGPATRQLVTVTKSKEYNTVVNDNKYLL